MAEALFHVLMAECDKVTQKPPLYVTLMTLSATKDPNHG
jgi:hypothetical protein